MTTREFLLSAWSWHPVATVAWASAVAGYVFLSRRQSRSSKGNHHPGSRRTLPYLLGSLLLFTLTLNSPLNALADGYLFSAHMLQHLLLLLIVPLLLLLALPRTNGTAGSGTRLGGVAQRILNQRLLTWLAGVGAMWFWHAPTLCSAATSNRTVGAIQTVSLLLLGGAFWWPIAGPSLNQRLPPLPGVLYLFTACVGCTLLGIILTFAPVEVCSVYLHPADRLGILPLIRNGWGINPAVDQQVGGLLMWVPACFIYLSASVTLLMRWFSGSEPAVQTASESPQPSYP